MLHKSHGNLSADRAERIALPGSGQMDADQLEQVVAAAVPFRRSCNSSV